MPEGVRQVYAFSFYKYLLSTSSGLPLGAYPVFVLKKLTLYCKKLKFRFKCSQKVLMQKAAVLFWPYRSDQVIEFSLPNYLKSFSTSRKTPSQLCLLLYETARILALWDASASWASQLVRDQAPAVCSPHPPEAAAASPLPSALPAPLGSTSAWPTALPTPPPLAAPASSAFLWDPLEERVTA